MKKISNHFTASKMFFKTVWTILSGEQAIILSKKRRSDGERNLDIQNSTENIKKQYFAENMKREFGAIKEEWIKKKINLSELTDKMSEKIPAAKESSVEYCKFLY